MEIRMNEKLEQEIERYIPTSLAVKFPTTDIETIKSDIRYIARHFAKWGAEHRGSSEIPKDLESYAQTIEDYYDVGEEGGYLCTHRGDIKNAVLAGAKWQKEQLMDEWLKDRDGCFWDGVEEGKKAMREQMMKEAVEGVVVKDINNKLAVTAKNVNLDKFKFGDQVRVIIFKKEDI